MSRLRRFGKGMGWRLGLVLGSVLLTLAIAEGVARLAVPDEVHAFFTPFEHDDSSYATQVKDPKLLYTLAWYVPGAEGVTGSAPVKINNLGLRDEHDYPLQKPAGCYRVLALGDSMTFGKGVAAEDTFLAVLEDTLQARHPGRCIEILNAGMPNTNFYIQWAHYQLQWHQFQPDLVLVCFFVYNDSQLEGEEEPYSLRWMELVDHYDWLKESALVRWAYYRGFFDLGANAMERDLPRFFDTQYKGWQQFTDSVADLQKMAADNGAKVAFALVPIPEGYDEYPYHAYHEQLIQFLMGRHQIPVADIVRGLGGIKAREHWVHPSDGHPDVFLHREMGLYLSGAFPWTQWMGAR